MPDTGIVRFIFYCSNRVSYVGNFYSPLQNSANELANERTNGPTTFTRMVYTQYDEIKIG